MQGHGTATLSAAGVACLTRITRLLYVQQLVYNNANSSMHRVHASTGMTDTGANCSPLLLLLHLLPVAATQLLVPVDGCTAPRRVAVGHHCCMHL